MATSPQDFTPQGAGSECLIIVFIYSGVAYTAGQLLFQLPAPVQELTQNIRGSTIIQMSFQFRSQVTHLLQKYRLITPSHIYLLFSQNAGCLPYISSVDEEHVVTERLPTLSRIDYKFVENGLVGVKLNVAKPAVSGNILVLFADRLPQNINLDVTCLPGQFFRRFKDSFIGVKGIQQADGKAT